MMVVFHKAALGGAVGWRTPSMSVWHLSSSGSFGWLTIIGSPSSAGGMQGEPTVIIQAMPYTDFLLDHIDIWVGFDLLLVEIQAVDVYDFSTGEIRSSSTDNIACWFIDTNNNGESFFARHANFTGADEPYKKLKRKSMRRRRAVSTAP